MSEKEHPSFRNDTRWEVWVRDTYGLRRTLRDLPTEEEARTVYDEAVKEEAENAQLESGGPVRRTPREFFVVSATTSRCVVP